MKFHTNRNLPAHSMNKVMPLAALTFFLSSLTLQAQDNVLTGGVYSESASKDTVLSSQPGEGDAAVFNPATTTLLLDKTISGYVSISNDFSAFTLTGTGGSLTASNTPALAAYNGSNLTVQDGTFSGGILSQSSNEWASSTGLLLSNISTGRLTDVTFSGKAIENDSSPLDPTSFDHISTNASGSSGMVILSSQDIRITGTTSTGGYAGAANGDDTAVQAFGGTGLEIYNSSAVISNSTFTGGAGGTAGPSSSSASVNGGDGIYAVSSTLEIHGGTSSGGAAGTANGADANGGFGLAAVGGSAITIHNGTFEGVNAPALWIEDSSLTTFGGSFTQGGLYSLTTGNSTNTIHLDAGTFSGLEFINRSNGYQNVTLGNIILTGDIYQEGGTVEITASDNGALQELMIENGTMVFNNDFVLNGLFSLNSVNSTSKFQNAELADGSIFDVNLGLLDVAGSLSNAAGSTLNILVLSNQNGLVTAGTAAFSSNSTLRVDASLASFSTGVTTRTIITTQSGLAFDTNSVNTEIVLNLNTNVSGRTSFSGFDTSGNNLALIFNRETLSAYWGVSNGPLSELAAELETLAPPEMNLLIDNLGAAQSSSQIEQTYFTTLNTFQAAKQGLDAAVGLSLSRGTEFRDQLLLPKGAQGPKLQPQSDWRLWLKYYGSLYSKDREGTNPEYDSTLHGGVLGMDKNFGRLLIGLSAGAGNYRIEAEQNASQQMNAFQGTVYSTYGFDHAYLDLGLAYGFNQVNSRTAEPFVLEGEFDTQLISAYLGTGWGFDFPSIGTVLTPEASVRYTMYEQDAYTETGTAAAPRSFDAFDSDSMVGIVGLNAAMLDRTALSTFAFKLDGRAHWMREFNPEPGELNYSLVGGANDYTIIYPFLDEDMIRLGFGFTFFNTKKNSLQNVLLRLDFDELFGKDFNSHNLSAKVIYAF